MTSKVSFFSDNEELYSSFKRALRAVGDIDVSKNLVKNSIVMFVMENNKDFGSWLWGEFRTKKKAINPLLVIGTEDKASFLVRFPVFSTYSDEHAYIQIPFDLSELLNTINNLKPIYDHVTKKLIVADYSKGYEHKLITHDLKIVERDKKAAVENFLKVRNFYDSIGEKEIVKLINEKIKIMGNMDEWEQVAVEVKEGLESRLKAKRSK